MTLDTRLFLDSVESYLTELVAPLAFQIDQSSDALKTALQGLSAHSLLAVRIPRAWGGIELEPETFYSLQQLISRYSGALAFLQLQHQGAVRDIINSENERLKQHYLPKIIQEKTLLGQGFSQLRRTGDPMVKAMAVDGGYLIKGNVPWITGLGFFDAFILGAILPDGQELRGIISLEESAKKTDDTIIFSDPLKLGAMQSTNTVTATLDNYFLPIDDIVSLRYPGAIHDNDKQVVLYPSFLVLGCAEAGLDIIKTVAHTKQLAFIQAAFHRLNDEFNHCQTKIREAIKVHPRSFEEDLQLRVWAINLAQRCAQAAITVSSGAANYQTHPAQRVYREALVFSVFAQTKDLMEATLEKLVI